MRSEAGEPFKTALCAQAGEALPLICAGVKGLASRTPASSGFKALIPLRGGCLLRRVLTAELLTQSAMRAQSALLGAYVRHATNINTAYAAGRYKQQLEDVDIAPYMQYMCIVDDATRPEHRAMHGKIFRYDDPFWTSFYPPNG